MGVNIWKESLGHSRNSFCCSYTSGTYLYPTRFVLFAHPLCCWWKEDQKCAPIGLIPNGCLPVTLALLRGPLLLSKMTTRVRTDSGHKRRLSEVWLALLGPQGSRKPGSPTDRVFRTIIIIIVIIIILATHLVLMQEPERKLKNGSLDGL